MESTVQNPEKQRKVLIVEDNERNLKLFRLIIGSLGYEVFSARNGEEGVRMAKEIIPVIALTSYAMKGDRERLLYHGFVDYIAKPVRKDILIKAVKKALGIEMTD